LGHDESSWIPVGEVLSHFVKVNLAMPAVGVMSKHLHGGEDAGANGVEMI
jgi:hypothetical protein